MQIGELEESRNESDIFLKQKKHTIGLILNSPSVLVALRMIVLINL